MLLKSKNNTVKVGYNNTVKVGYLNCLNDAGTAIGEKLLIDRTTHVGRVDHVNVPQLCAITSCGTMAGAIGKPSVALNLANLRQGTTVSKHHALIIRTFMSDSDQSTWSVLHIGSSNATIVNGREISKGNIASLESGCLLQFGGVRTIFTIREKEVKTRALVVGSPGSYPPLPGVEGDVKEMTAALKRRSSIESVDVLYQSQATRAAVVGKLGEYAKTQSESSLTLFYYSGHGSRQGLCTHTNSYFGNDDLTPRELYEAVTRIPGQKIIILDSCHSSIFMSDIPSRTLVLSGETPSGHMLEGSVTVMANKIIGIHEQETGIQMPYNPLHPQNCIGLFLAPPQPFVIGKPFTQGYLTRAIIKYLEAHRNDRIDLKNAVPELQAYHNLQKNHVALQAEGLTINF